MLILPFLSGPAAARELQTVKDRPLDASYLRRHAETRGFMLGRPVQPQPTPDGKAVLFLRSQPRQAQLRLYEFDLASGKTRELLTPEMVLRGVQEKLTPEEKARRERQRVSVGGFTRFQLSEDGARILVSLSGKLYVVERGNGTVQKMNTGPGTLLDPRFAPDGKSVAFVRDNDLHVLDLAGQKETPVTKGGSERRTHGLAEFVAQEEMGRFSGYWWSPDSKHLAYEEADADGVEIWHVADPIHPDRPANPTFYPRPGKANVKVRLGIVAATGGKTTWVKWDEQKYPYLAAVRWAHSGPLTILVQTREQTEQVLLRVDPRTGKTTGLLIERDPVWVNIHSDGPRWLKDGSFLWSSEGPTGPRLEQREPNGARSRVLVPAEQGYQGMVDVDPDAGSVVYKASTDPTEAHLFRLALESGKPVALTKEPGIYNAVFSKNHAIYALQASTASSMPVTTVHARDGKLLGTLPSVAEDPPFVPRAELVKVGAEPGFYCSILRPHTFDAGKRYPVIVHVYGGPHHQQVLAPMSTRLIDQWLADQGFIIVSIDNRGTPGRGRDWERAIGKHFGTVPLEDQIAGLKALGRRFPEMDLDRVGIYGWSFGGYMSALAVLRRPSVFKAGVAGAPVVDWLDYDTHYTERYLGLPDKEPSAYREGSLLTYAQGLKRPLLLVHGTADDNVYFRHTLKLADALFRAGKDFEVLPLSGLTHMVPDPVVMERLYGRFARFFEKHLGKPESKR